MPTSYAFFKPEIKQYFKENVPISKKILDVGPGIGTYSDLLRDLGYSIDCIEVFEPYIHEYNLKEKYDNVFIGNIVDFDISNYDFIIFGDVLEHISVEDSQRLIKNIIENGKDCLVAIPYEMEQGSHFDNDYETHLQPDLTPKVMNQRFPQLKTIYSNVSYGYYVNKKQVTKVDKAYILYANESYLPIITTCIQSIQEYSKLPVFVYMLNSDTVVELENVTTIKWVCDLEGRGDNMYDTSSGNLYINRNNEKIYKLLIQRPLVTKHALENYAKTVAYIDCDSVATPNVERIFSYYNDKLNYPYFVEGIYDYLIVNGRGGAESREDLSTTLEHPACELFGVNQYVRQKYRQSGYYVAGENTTDFLEEWYWMCMHPKVLRDFAYYAPYNEETILNVLLWKYDIQDGLPYLYVNGSLDVVDKVYTEIEFKGYTQSLGSWFKVPAYKEDLLFFHGEKRTSIMDSMISRVKDYTSNTRKKILYITPHLSTGGQPQYLLEKVRCFKEDFDVHVAEYNLASNEYVIQRTQLQWILGNKFHVVGEDKKNLLSIIKKVRPDIIHIEEVPEFFMSDEIAVEIFGKVNRDYFIVTTTHSSNTTPSALKFHPDKFVLVSKWSQNKFTEELPNVPNDIWEYPIGNYNRNQRQAQQELKFDPEYKHVLMVGLFTPGKNQGEIFEVAKQLENYKIKFHFVGNQAGNFKEYWEPIMQTKPDNCIIWGERNDVANFYQACDLFYFSSKLELNPLSIKEALSYGLPCIFRRLHTYLDSYDSNKRVAYIDEDLVKTKEIILNILEPDFIKKPRIQIIHLLTRPDDEREKRSIADLSNCGIDYIQMVNEVYDKEPPVENCLRPEMIGDKPEAINTHFGRITGRHYGCYLAHINALKAIDTKNYDFTLICEADATIFTDTASFVKGIYKAAADADRLEAYYISMCRNRGYNLITIDNDYYQAQHQVLAHCYLIPNDKKDWYLEQIKTTKWDVADLWYNDIFRDYKHKRVTTTVEYSRQASGYSLLDQMEKNWDE